MNRKIGQIKAWLIILLLLIGGLIVLIWLRSSDENQTAEESSSLPKIPSVIEEDNTKLANLSLSKDGNECDDIQDFDLKNQCQDNLYFVRGTQQSDIEACKLIETSLLKEQCLDKVNYKIALKNGEGEMCKKILNETLQHSCLDQLKLNATKSTSEDCKILSSKGLKRDCEDDLILTEAVRKQEMDLCNQIENQEKQGQCLKAIEQNRLIIQAANNQGTKVVPESKEIILQKCDTLDSPQREICKTNLQ